jgi:hypothetical protein
MTHVPGSRDEFPGPVSFTLPDGRTFDLDVLAAYFDLQEGGAPFVEQGRPHAAYLKEVVIPYVREKTGVELHVAQADWLNDRIQVLYAEKKSASANACRAAWDSLQITPASTSSG